MDYAVLIFQAIVFPGLLFTAVVGLITTWIDRRVTAGVHMRVGPPLLQPFYDIAKYMIKETCVPAGGSHTVFLLAPLFGLAAVTAASTIIWRTLLSPSQAFVGDLIVVLYLLTIPAISVIVGSFVSRNPLASVGGSREMKLLMGYEVPFVLAACVAIIKTNTINLGDIVSQPAVALAPSGIIALIVGIVCTQAKLTLVPFDMAEAETELAGGAFIEYSGPPLGMFKLTHAMMFFTVPMFLVTLFWGGMHFNAGPVTALAGILKYVALVVIAVLIRNTAPRMRIDQAVRFFWGPMTILALVGVALGLAGW
jgi:NADH-quinone oxidoreductase subunit H